jgi:hypothetical protein
MEKVFLVTQHNLCDEDYLVFNSQDELNGYLNEYQDDFGSFDGLEVYKCKRMKATNKFLLED